MYIQAGNTAVELAQNAQTFEVLKAAGATMPGIPDEEKNTLLLECAFYYCSTYYKAVRVGGGG